VPLDLSYTLFCGLLTDSCNKRWLSSVRLPVCPAYQLKIGVDLKYFVPLSVRYSVTVQVILATYFLFAASDINDGLYYIVRSDQIKRHHQTLYISACNKWINLINLISFFADINYINQQMNDVNIITLCQLVFARGRYKASLKHFLCITAVLHSLLSLFTLIQCINY